MPCEREDLIAKGQKSPPNSARRIDRIRYPEFNINRYFTRQSRKRRDVGCDFDSSRSFSSLTLLIQVIVYIPIVSGKSLISVFVLCEGGCDESARYAEGEEIADALPHFTTKN